MRLRAALILALSLLGACGGSPKMAVEGAWARAVLGSGSVYLALSNRGGTADTLVSARCDEAALAEIHLSYFDQGMMGMEPAGELRVNPGETLEFKPLALHVMLAGLKRRFKKGDTLHIEFVFQKSAPLRFEAVVREP